MLDVTSRNYSLGSAALLAVAADLAYEDTAQHLANAMAELGLTGVEVTLIKQQDTQGMLVLSDAAILCAFRGTTANAEDFAVDLGTAFVPGPEGQVHQGFWEDSGLVWPQFAAGLRAALTAKPRPIFLTGHSLGGALVAMIAARLYHEAPDIAAAAGGRISAYTYGQPRVGDSDFGKWLMGQLGPYHFRHVNADDIVPRVPPEWPGYAHFGQQSWFDQSGAVTIATGEPPAYGPAGASVQDHFMANYVRLCAGAAGFTLPADTARVA
ncbi:MAG TPA: lipase family protein [Alphaproteobacteria bacterium]|nr:lipase family protein [Alphaproteobacteria bacterium]